ncbi:MAG TPA: glycosyltransferase, partial [Tepidisphaeraceae bacterium]|nr:glycosyltransferase [Tepidisphaeraceae bacterium]
MVFPLAATIELSLLLAYMAAGPMVWGILGVALFAGRRKMLLMHRPGQPIKGDLPWVSILIPAKDEEARIRGCLESALAQDYPNIQVIAIDDRSTDGTGAVMDDLAREHSSLEIIHVTEPPEPSWTGKNNALYTGTQHASGQWLLYVDSDVVLEPDALRVAMGVVLRKKFDLLSLLPRLECHSFWESILVPLAGSAASTMYLIALTNKSDGPKTTAFANGQFLLISRPAYDAIGGHEAVRDRYCEDVEIARLLRVGGFRPRVAWGNDFAAVRMYSSLGAIIRGWSRIYYAARVGSPWRPLAGMAFLVFCCFTAYAALGWGIWRTLHPLPGWWVMLGLAWIITAAQHLVGITWLVGQMYAWSGNPRRNAAWFPLAGGMLFWIFGRSVKMCITRKVEWRGTAYSHKMARDAAAPNPA